MSPVPTPQHDPPSAPESEQPTGLSSSQAAALLRQIGHNEVPEQRSSPVLRFLKKFWGVTSWMLEAMIVLSWLLKRYSDLYVILGLLIINAILSFMQEERASTVVEALRTRLQVNARVLRDGQWTTLPARELVPGDVIRLRAGDYVPADMRVMEGHAILDESALTGESVHAVKSIGELLYAGSVMRQGEVSGEVTATGVNTYFGRTTELVQIARPRMHIEKMVSRLVARLLIIVLALLAVAVAVAVVRGTSLVEMLPLLLVLLMGAVPVSLPVMFTVSLALSAKDLAVNDALVTRLTALEDAALMDVLCVDKTGTLTTNQLSVADVVPLNGYNADDAILYGVWASQQANQDPIDLAFFAEAQRRGLDGDATTLSFAPFDPSTRRTEAQVERQGATYRVAKGAVSAIVAACELGERAAELEALAEQSALRGLRTLAVALGRADNTFDLVGLVNLTDELRPDSTDLIAALHDRGITVVMLTGDALPVATETASRLGLGTNISRAVDLENLSHSDLAQAAALAEISDGFAEIYPEGKYAVVQSLQARGHVVGMTGDGVNDAPALRQAEVGIAVSNATDVAKGAASVVLTSEGLSGIVNLVDDGRRIHQRILNWIVNKVSRATLKTVFIVGAYLLTGDLVVSALAMLLTTFLTDFVKIALSTDTVRGSRSPETWDISAPIKIGLVMGLLMAAEAFGLLAIARRYFDLGNNLPALRTCSFLVLFYFAVFSLLLLRERGHFWSSRPSKTLGIAMGVSFIIGTALALIGLPEFAALPWWQVLLILMYSLVFGLFVNDLVEVHLARRMNFV